MFLPVFFALAVALPAASGVTPSDLRCEYRRNPLGIDQSKPHLSWVLAASRKGEKQTAYQVLVATSEARLRAGQGDLWNSGKVSASDAIQIAYLGTPLVSRQRYYWKVRAWDKDGTPSAWSAPASWSMGILTPGEWTARWIALDEHAAPVFRKPFAVSKPLRRATAWGRPWAPRHSSTRFVYDSDGRQEVRGSQLRLTGGRRRPLVPGTAPFFLD